MPGRAEVVISSVCSRTIPKQTVVHQLEFRTTCKLTPPPLPYFLSLSPPLTNLPLDAAPTKKIDLSCTSTLTYLVQVFLSMNQFLQDQLLRDGST
jgi:hypothetical protein